VAAFEILNLIQDLERPVMAITRVSYVYILANRSRTIYVGVTADLERRVWEHRFTSESHFTTRYNIDQLVWFDESDDIRVAIARETQIKNWRREWKTALVEKDNPSWNDLAGAWYDSRDPESSSG
jgi:putative endonuclease